MPLLLFGHDHLLAHVLDADQFLDAKNFPCNLGRVGKEYGLESSMETEGKKGALDLFSEGDGGSCEGDFEVRWGW